MVCDSKQFGFWVTLATYFSRDWDDVFSIYILGTPGVESEYLRMFNTTKAIGIINPITKKLIISIRLNPDLLMINMFIEIKIKNVIMQRPER